MEELTKPFSIIYQESWLNGEVSDDWKGISVTPTYRVLQKGRKEELGSYRLVSLTSGYRADHLECQHMAHTGQPRDQAQTTRVCGERS